MSEQKSTWCRLTECGAGLQAHVEGDRIVSLKVDPEHPMGRHGTCGVCEGSIGARDDARRILRPRRRVGDAWQEATWDEALTDIAARWKAIRARGGAGAVGVHAGAPVGLDSKGLVRTLAFALQQGTSNLYSPLPTLGGPWVRACELVLGHPVALQSDVGRAHYVVLLGANQEAQGWGPLQSGRNLAADLAFSRRTKGTKLIAVDPRRTALAATADQHHRVLPGTELWFVLGMVRAILDNDWRDTQFTDDHCTPLAPLREALAPWTIERCAEICGVPSGDIGGVALKFSRAAMAVAHKSPQALASTHGTLTAWALLVLHALTANVMRPGGLYENRGAVDLFPVLRQLQTERAPHTRSTAHPLLLLQAPEAALAQDAAATGGDALRALITVQADPLRDLPGGEPIRAALRDLELLVAIDLADTATTRAAHWVLPTVHAWERADGHLHDTSILPMRLLQHTEALVAAPGEARPCADILRDLAGRIGPMWRGGAHGAHLLAAGQLLATSDLERWEERVLSAVGPVSLADVRAAQHGSYHGEVDRAVWRVSHAHGRLDLLPTPIADALAALSAPETPAELPLRLLTSASRDAALRAFDRPADAADPGVGLHPDAGFADGARVRVRTAFGACEAAVRLDPALRAGVVDLPAGHAADVAALIPADVLDPLTGTAAWNGLACRVEPV